MLKDAMEMLEEIQNNERMGSEKWIQLQEIKSVFTFLSEVMHDEIYEYIDNCYEGEFDMDNVDEAISYLGDFYDEEMEDEEAVDEANDLQREYYEHEADIYEMLDKAIEIYEA